MRVTLDLDALLADGKLTEAEAARLASYAAPAASVAAFSALIGFGLVAVSAGLILLIPDARTGIALGALLLLAGLVLYRGGTRWEILGHICVILGAIGIAGGVVVLTEGARLALAAIAVGFAAIGIFARSSLLIVGAVLAASCVLGGDNSDFDPAGFLGITVPATTILVFGVGAIAAYLLSTRLRGDGAQLALTAARTGLFLVNVAFWVGSVWGDSVDWLGQEIDRLVFAVVWAVCLLALAVWGVARNRAWAVNAAAVAGIIHLLTQWFLQFGASPTTILIAGVVALVTAVVLWNFNRRLWQGRRRQVGTA